MKEGICEDVLYDVMTSDGIWLEFYSDEELRKTHEKLFPFNAVQLAPFYLTLFILHEWQKNHMKQM